MPVYCYLCPDGHRFEEVRSIKEGDTATCPTCSKPSRRVPQPSVSGKVLGGTPKFYPGRKGK